MEQSAFTKLPDLPYHSWQETNQTLHLMLQVVGKIRLALQPRLNHWWHAPLYITSRGLTTRAMPTAHGVAQFDFDFVDHVLYLRASDGFERAVELGAGSIAQFYRRTVAMLTECDVHCTILPLPFDEAKVRSTIPFAEDETHGTYDGRAVETFFRVLTRIEPIFQEFRGRFLGKSSPVHLFWHSMDLALTRFSGVPAPAISGADPVTRDAYSHEVVSFGFWAGDPAVPEPMFYSYTAPEPAHLAETPLSPDGAEWRENGGAHLALFPYATFRTADDPRNALLTFFESAYTAGARLAGWDIPTLRYEEAYPSQ